MRWLLPLLLAFPAMAEEAEYGSVWLTGLARDSWPLNPPGEQFAMVCNVNGPDEYLSVRAGPGTEYEIRRNLKRLAILTVDTRQRQGHWVKVVTAQRNTDTEGNDILFKDLHVEGWAHDGYMCDFVH